MISSVRTTYALHLMDEWQWMNEQNGEKKTKTQKLIKRMYTANTRSLLNEKKRKLLSCLLVSRKEICPCELGLRCGATVRINNPFASIQTIHWKTIYLPYKTARILCLQKKMIILNGMLARIFEVQRQQFYIFISELNWTAAAAAEIIHWN